MDFVTATLWAMNVLDTNVLVVVKTRTGNIVFDVELILRQRSNRQCLAIVLYYDGLQIGSSGHSV